MERHSDEKKATSCRRFIKYVGMAITALLFLSNLAYAQAQHDIPPPILFADSSLEIETDVDFAGPPSPTSPNIYTRPATASGKEISHIRILQGNGEIIYQNLFATGSSMTLTLKSRNGLTNIIQVTGDATAFRINSGSKRLQKSKGHGKRPNRLIHPALDTSDFRIESIEIRNASNNRIFMATSRPFSSTFTSEEYRILLWLH